MIAETLNDRSTVLIFVLADLALQTIVLVCLMALTLRIFRVRDSAQKLAFWTAVLYTALALPLCSAWVPAITLRMPVRRAERTEKLIPSSAGPGVPQADAVGGHDAALPVAQQIATERLLPAAVDSGRPMAAQRKPFPWGLTVTVVYLLIAFLLAMRIAIAAALTRRLRQRLTQVCDAAALHLVMRGAREMRLGKAPALLESPFVAVPLSVGVAVPAILLPSAWRSWDEAKLSAVMMHELSHLRRRDPLTRVLSLLYRAVFWFNPVSWWLERHLAELAEQASDQEAIRSGSEPAYYAEVVMSFFKVMSQQKRRVAVQGIWMAAGKCATGRIEQILSTQSRGANSRKRYVMWGVFPLLLAVAAIQPRLIFAAQQAPAPAPQSQTQAAWPVTQSPPAVVPENPPVPPAATPESGVPPVPDAAPVILPEPLPAPPDLAIVGAVPGGVAGGIVTGIPGGLAGGIVTIAPPLPIAGFPLNTGPGVWQFGSMRGGMDFAIVSSDWITVNGSEDDRQAVEALRKKITGVFIWFIHDGKAYIIRDAATVQAAKQFYLRRDMPNPDAEVVRAQLEKLNQKQKELEQKMEAVRVTVPNDLIAKLQALEAEDKALGETANIQQLNQLMQELGNVERQLGEAERNAGESQRAIGDQMRQLGEQERELARREAEMARDRSEIGINSHVTDLINRSLANGTAKRVE